MRVAAPHDSGDSSAPADGNGAPLAKAEELWAASEALMAPSEEGKTRTRGVRPPEAEPSSVGPLMSATAAGRDSEADEGDESLEDAADESRGCEVVNAFSHHTLGAPSCGAAASTPKEDAGEVVVQCFQRVALAEARRLDREDTVVELLEQHRRALQEEDYERMAAMNALIKEALTEKPKHNRRKRRSNVGGTTTEQKTCCIIGPER